MAKSSKFRFHCKKQCPKLVLLIFLPSFLICSLVIFTLYLHQQKQKKQQAIEACQFYLKSQESIIKAPLNEIYSDIIFLKHLSSLKIALLDSSPEYRKQAIEDLTSFCKNHLIYEKVDIISSSGDEKIVVVSDESSFFQKPDNLLTNKKNSPEFQKVLTLSDQTIFQFPLQPLTGSDKTVLTVGTKLLSDQGDMLGVILVTFTANKLINTLNQTPRPLPEVFRGLISADGAVLDFSPEIPNLNQSLFSELKDTTPSTRHLEDGIVVTTPFIFKKALDHTNGSIPLRKNWDLSDIDFANPFVNLIAYIPQQGLLHYMQGMSTIFISSFIGASIILLTISYLFALFISQIRLREETKNKSAFVANVAHEFKTPLCIIREDLELIKEELDPSRDENKILLLDQGKKTIDRLNRLVLNLLESSNIERGKVSLKKEIFDFCEVLSNVLEQYAIELQNKQITIHQEISSSLSPIFADKDKIIEVLLNLLSNAIKYTPEKGLISIKAWSTPDAFTFTITNTGKGLTAEEIKIIFNKFERLSAEKEAGTGLGLPIAEEIVRLHGGSLTVGSELNHSTTFTLELPIKEVPHE